MQNVSEMSIESLIEVVRGQHLHEYSAEAALEIVDRLSKSEKKDVLDEISNECLGSIIQNMRDKNGETMWDNSDKDRRLKWGKNCDHRDWNYIKVCSDVGSLVAMKIVSEMSRQRIDAVDNKTFGKLCDMALLFVLIRVSQERIDQIGDEFLWMERSEVFQIKILLYHISDKRLNAMDDDTLLRWRVYRPMYKVIERLTVERVNQMSNETLTRFYTGPQMEVIQKMSEERVGKIDKDTYLKLGEEARLKAVEKVGRLAEFEPDEPKNVETKNVETKLNEKVQAEFKPQEESVAKPPVEPAVEYENENGCCETF